MNPNLPPVYPVDRRTCHNSRRCGYWLLVSDIQGDRECRLSLRHFLGNDIAHGAVENGGDDPTVQQIRMGVESCSERIESSVLCRLASRGVSWSVHRKQLLDSLFGIPGFRHQGVTVARLAQRSRHAHNVE